VGSPRRLSGSGYESGGNERSPSLGGGSQNASSPREFTSDDAATAALILAGNMSFAGNMLLAMSGAVGSPTSASVPVHDALGVSEATIEDVQPERIAMTTCLEQLQSTAAPRSPRVVHMVPLQIVPPSAIRLA
jgi:hypothetical protein